MQVEFGLICIISVVSPYLGLMKKIFDQKDNKANSSSDFLSLRTKQNRSTEGCSKLKSLEARHVQESLVSTLQHLQVPKWDRTRCLEETASYVGMSYPLQMFYGNLSQ